MSKRWINMSKSKEGSSLKKLAAGSLTFVKAYSNGQANSAIDTLEQELEAEISRDKKAVPNTRVARLRHKGGKVLRSKHVLLMIVLLNIIDCALVLGELVLDLHHVKDTLTASQTTSSTFLQNMQSKYPEAITTTEIDQLHKVYDQILNAYIHWDYHNNSTEHEQGTNKSSNAPKQTQDATSGVGGSAHIAGFIDIDNILDRQKRNMQNSDQFDRNIRRILNRHFRDKYGRHLNFRFKRSSSSGRGDKTGSDTGHSGRHNSTEEKIAKILHKFSIGIVCILLVETSMKIFCFGKHFCDQKLEVFDAFIVVSSFIVDLIFLQGLSVYAIQDFVFILAFLLPWGVIRVVNSLVVAVRNHEHFRLKLLYTQKKGVENENKQLRQEKDKFAEQLDSLRRLCLVEGVDDWKIQQSLARQVMKPGKGIMGSFASLAMGALGARSNGSSIWNLIGTPKMKRGKSEEWEGKLGGGKDDSRSLRFTERLWTVSGTQDFKKLKKPRTVNQQGTTESDPGGTPPTIKGRLKAIKRFLKRQETVSSFSSTETLDKHSKCSMERLSSSENTTPAQSFDYGSVNDIDRIEDECPRNSLSCDVINECAEDRSDIDSMLDTHEEQIEDGDIELEKDCVVDKNRILQKQNSISSFKDCGESIEVVVNIENDTKNSRAVETIPPIQESNDSPKENEIVHTASVHSEHNTSHHQNGICSNNKPENRESSDSETELQEVVINDNDERTTCGGGPASCDDEQTSCDDVHTSCDDVECSRNLISKSDTDKSDKSLSNNNNTTVSSQQIIHSAPMETSRI